MIKVCATGGVLSLGDDVGAAQVTQAEMDAIVDEAHRLGRKTAAHAHGAEGAKVAIRAGIDSIEHGSFLDDEAVRMMRERGTFLVPTLMAGEYAGGRKVTRKYPPEIAAKALQALDGRSAAFKRAAGAGVRIAFGTDSGVSPHGRNAEEFALLVEHGLSTAAALRTSSAAAVLLGIDRTTGTIEAGKEADIVAAPGDALRSIAATEKVRFVMKGGKIFRKRQVTDAERWKRVQRLPSAGPADAGPTAYSCVHPSACGRRTSRAPIFRPSWCTHVETWSITPLARRWCSSSSNV